MAFGAPSGGGLFGSPFPTNASPGFGQSAPAPSPFGASAPAFGAPASQGAFSFSQATPTAAPATNLFGTPAASPSPFGGTPGSLFGGANASPGAFGANATPAPFGASTAPNIFGGASTPAFGGGFGAASSPSLFGASTPATTSAFGGTMFGAQPASGGGMFGSQQAGTSLFGTPQPAAGGGMFGAQQPTAANVFGAPQAAAPSMFGAPAAAPAPQTDSTVKELMEIKAAYTPGNPLYRFQYLLLNVVDNPASRVKPPGIDELRWRQALAAAGGPDNPDRLWPVPANGFRDLVARSTAQVSAVDENAARLRALQDLAFRLAKRQGGDLKQRATDIQRQHQELASRLLHVTRLLDALESRLATTMGYRGDVARAKEDKLSRQLAAVEMELAPGSVTGLTRRLDATAHAAHMAAANPVASAAAQTKLDDRSNAALLSVLRDHADGVAKLQALLKRDLQDVAIMRHELGGDGPGGGQGMVQLD